MDKTQKNLMELGLTPNEALVYLANLELGPATAQQLAAKAAVVRPTAYVAIGGLVKRGLMSQFKKGKKGYYQAEKPERLAHLLELEKREITAREAKLKEIMPMLSSLISLSGDKPEVKYYEGFEGLEAMRSILVGLAPKEMDVITTRHYVKSIPGESTAVHFYRMGEIGMKVRQAVFTQEKNKPTLKVKQGKGTFEYRYINVSDSKDFGEISIFGDHVALIAYLEKPYGFLVKSKQIANTARALFEAFWKGNQ